MAAEQGEKEQLNELNDIDDYIDDGEFVDAERQRHRTIEAEYWDERYSVLTLR